MTSRKLLSSVAVVGFVFQLSGMKTAYGAGQSAPPRGRMDGNEIRRTLRGNTAETFVIGGNASTHMYFDPSGRMYGRPKGRKEAAKLRWRVLDDKWCFDDKENMLCYYLLKTANGIEAWVLIDKEAHPAMSITMHHGDAFRVKGPENEIERQGIYVDHLEGFDIEAEIQPLYNACVGEKNVDACVRVARAYDSGRFGDHKTYMSEFVLYGALQQTSDLTIEGPLFEKIARNEGCQYQQKPRRSSLPYIDVSYAALAHSQSRCLVVTEALPKRGLPVLTIVQTDGRENLGVEAYTGIRVEQGADVRGHRQYQARLDKQRRDYAELDTQKPRKVIPLWARGFNYSINFPLMYKVVAPNSTGSARVFVHQVSLVKEISRGATGYQSSDD